MKKNVAAIKSIAVTETRISAVDFDFVGRVGWDGDVALAAGAETSAAGTVTACGGASFGSTGAGGTSTDVTAMGGTLVGATIAVGTFAGGGMGWAGTSLGKALSRKTWVGGAGLGTASFGGTRLVAALEGS